MTATDSDTRPSATTPLDVKVIDRWMDHTGYHPVKDHIDAALAQRTAFLRALNDIRYRISLSDLDGLPVADEIEDMIVAVLPD